MVVEPGSNTSFKAELTAVGKFIHLCSLERMSVAEKLIRSYFGVTLLRGSCSETIQARNGYGCRTIMHTTGGRSLYSVEKLSEFASINQGKSIFEAK